MAYGASQLRDWLAGFSRYRSRIRRTTGALPVAALAAMLLIAGACSGVNDNGTDHDTLATLEARTNQPPPATGSPPAGGGDAQLAEQGRQLATSLGCTGCHSVDGSTIVGPTWQGMYGSEVTLESGETVTADDAYIHESILDPGAKIHEGFTAVPMPPFEGRVSDDDINAIIAYIKTLQ